MRKLFFLFLLLPSILLADTGNTNKVGLEIDSSGWVCRVTLGGDTTTSFGTNVGFFNGFGTNNTPSITNKLVFTVTSSGYTAAGIATTYTRTVYGTSLLRLAYPLQNTNDVQFQDSGGTNVVAKVTLSEPIYSIDTVTATSLGGYLRNTNTPADAAAFSGATVTNSSTQLWYKPIANWTYPGRWRETNSVITVRTIGFHTSASIRQTGRPLACMQHIITDVISGNKFTNTVSEMTVERGFTKGLYFGEYISTFPLSNFTNLAPIRIDFIAYPWFGTNPLSTLDNTYLGITGVPTSITNLVDRSRVESLPSYSETFAVVDTGGSDVNGRATNNTGGPTTLSSTLYFASIAKAANQIQATNNGIYAHSDVGGGIIYVKNGITAWLGASSTYGTQGWAHITIMPYPGDTVNITNQVNNNDISDLIRCYSLNFNGQIGGANGALFNGTDTLLFERCTFNSVNTAMFTSGKLNWFLNCDLNALGSSSSQGFKPGSGSADQFMFRGCSFDGFNTQICPQLMVGCIHPNTNGGDYIIRSEVSGQTGHTNKYGIWYNNFMGGFKDNSDGATIGAVSGAWEGFADVQNVYEFSTNNNNPNLCFHGTVNTVQYTNVIVWNNVMVGKRSGFFYNDSGSAASYKYFCQMLNNIMTISGFKTDTFGTPNAARIGNWFVMRQVSSSGNVHLDIAMDQGSVSFPPEFKGMRTYHPLGGTNTYTWLQVYNDKSWDGSSTYNSGGGGTYSLKSSTPLQVMQLRSTWVLPYDILGAYRSALDYPGAYAAGVPNKGF